MKVRYSARKYNFTIQYYSVFTMKIIHTNYSIQMNWVQSLLHWVLLVPVTALSIKALALKLSLPNVVSALPP